MSLKRAAFAAAACVLSTGCARVVPFTVDASRYASAQPFGELVADIISEGEVLHRFRLQLDEESTDTSEPLIRAGVVYGLTAFIDASGDGFCHADDDSVYWVFAFEADGKDAFVWEPVRGEFEDPRGCIWFAEPAAPDTGDTGQG